MYPYQAGGMNNQSNGKSSSNIPTQSSSTAQQSNLRQPYLQQVPTTGSTSAGSSAPFYQRSTSGNLVPHLSPGGILPPRSFVGNSPLNGLPPSNFAHLSLPYQQSQQPSTHQQGYRNEHPQQLDPKQLQKISSSSSSSSSPQQHYQNQSQQQQQQQYYQQAFLLKPQFQQDFSREQQQSLPKLTQQTNSSHQMSSRASTSSNPSTSSLSNQQDNKNLDSSVSTSIQRNTQSAPQQQDSTGKKKRGRPKKFILDPSTNTMIDSTHPNFKMLNKAMREGNNFEESTNGHVNSTNTNVNTNTNSSSNTNADLSGLFNASNTIGNFNDVELKELLKKKDRRGRPRKFAIEETGVTIKGVRINGSGISKKLSK